MQKWSNRKCEFALNNVINIDKLNKEKEHLERELRLQEEKSKELIENNANRIQDQKKYNKEFAELEKNYSELKEKYDGVVNSISSLQAHKKELENYVEKLKKQKTIIEEFDEGLFAAMIENIVINKENIMIITKDGRKVEIKTTNLHRESTDSHFFCQ